MERDFLNIPQVKTALNLTDIRRGQRNVDNAQKRKFEHSMALSVHVVNAYEWFNSDEGKLAFDEQGLSWTIEDLSKKVFGWGKSYFHKVRRCGSLDPRVVAAFNRKCDEAGDQAMRTIANLDKTREERVDTISTFCLKNVPGMDNVSVRLDANGAIHTTNSKADILVAMQTLKNFVDGLND